MGAVELQVTRVWETTLSIDIEAPDGFAVMGWLELDPDEEPTAADIAATFAGRACYESWHRPHPDRQTVRDYLDHIVAVQHFSVLSHANVGYYIQGISRSLTHELIRHRWVSLSQLSQRYVRIVDEIPYVVPPLCEGDPTAEGLLLHAAIEAHQVYERLVEHLTSTHPRAKPKEIREAARAVLPGMTETKLVISANLRAWRDLLEQRLPEGADAEIRRLARMLLVDLKQVAPESFRDIEAP